MSSQRESNTGLLTLLFKLSRGRQGHHWLSAPPLVGGLEGRGGEGKCLHKFDVVRLGLEEL
jgi:hypothetical protein